MYRNASKKIQLITALLPTTCSAWTKTSDIFKYKINSILIKNIIVDELNNIADTDDVVKMTKKINGGNIGLADRQQRYAKAMEVFGNPVSITEDAGDDDFDDHDEL